MHDEERPGNIRIGELRQLPVFSPDPRLWSRVVAIRRRRLRVRRSALALVAAVSLGALAALLPRAPAPLQQDVANGERESRALENEWLQFASSSQPAAPDLTRLRVIDAALQAAYDQGGDAQQIAPLWRERNSALRNLIARTQSPAVGTSLVITRI